MEPAFIDLSLSDIEPQGLLILWASLSDDFRGSLDNMLGGFIVALVVVIAWWVTTGE